VGAHLEHVEHFERLHLEAEATVHYQQHEVSVFGRVDLRGGSGAGNTRETSQEAGTTANGRGTTLEILVVCVLHRHGRRLKYVVGVENTRSRCAGEAKRLSRDVVGVVTPCCAPPTAGGWWGALPHSALPLTASVH
jgi:hypothetical protein